MKNTLKERKRVFPAYAGVFLTTSAPKIDAISLPRIRGGVSKAAEREAQHGRSSPHTRGCFRYYMALPAHSSGLPRIRGGVSEIPVEAQLPRESSPHTRGCFCWVGPSKKGRPVFPAYAGVFLCVDYIFGGDAGLPRIRGGVSRVVLPTPYSSTSSPHTRGCFRIQRI